MSHIFEPFFTTKGKLGGTGLGLAVVHSTVIGHRGVVLVSTKPGQGTRFDVLLPISGDSEAAEAVPPSAQPGSHRGSILLVDDSSEFGDMMMTTLFRLGYEVSVCDDPDEALGYLEEDPTAWDLLIADQNMPKMKGSDLVDAIKKIRPSLPCIICTADPSGNAKENARRVGAEGFATKPLDIGQFSLMVADLIAR